MLALPNTSSFDVHNARLILSGTAMHNEFFYKLESNFVDTVAGDSSPQLLDAYLGWKACDWASLKMGQFKTPISRQWNTEEWGLQFADRSDVSNYFSANYSQGLAGTFDTMNDGKLLLGAAMFNGESTGEGLNRGGTDTRHSGAVSLRWNAMGEMNPYVEGDVDWTENPALSFGGAYMYSDALGGNTFADGEKGKIHRISADGTFKMKGLSVGGEFFWQKIDPKDGDSDSPLGFYAQAGYFFEPKTFEVAARYGLVDCRDASTGECLNTDKLNEVDVSLNYYWWKHHLKAQLGWAFLNHKALEGSEDVNTDRWMFQLSSYF